jgi:hypothetical protein
MIVNGKRKSDTALLFYSSPDGGIPEKGATIFRFRLSHYEDASRQQTSTGKHQLTR